MKLIRAFRAMGAAAVLVLLAVVAHATLTQPDPGLRLTDWFSLQQAITFNNQLGFSPAVTAGAANTQSTCTALTNPLNNITSAVGNGSICLPVATAGRAVSIGNGSGQTINLFGSNTPFTSGTQDTINGTAGSTAYTSTTNGKNADCFAPANGTWFCTAGQ